MQGCLDALTRVAAAKNALESRVRKGAPTSPHLILNKGWSLHIRTCTGLLVAYYAI